MTAPERRQGGYSRREFLRHLGMSGAAAVVGGYALDVWDWSASAGAATFSAGDLGSGAKAFVTALVDLKLLPAGLRQLEAV